MNQTWGMNHPLRFGQHVMQANKIVKLSVLSQLFTNKNQYYVKETLNWVQTCNTE